MAASEADNINIDEIIRTLSQEFLADATETLIGLADLVSAARDGAGGTEETLQQIRRDSHNLKGLGGSFGFPSVTLIAHRLEDYLTGLDTLDVRQLEDVLAFLDALQDIVETGVNPGDDEVARIVRTLPAKGAAKEDFRPTSNHEILLVSASSIMGHAVEQKLHSLGLRVVTVKSPLQAFETAIRTRPDMIIASAVMEHVGGVDLARAFSAMAVTRKIPFVLLTSFDREHSELRELPESVGLIHHDRDLDEEITSTLKQLNLEQ